MLLEKDGLLLLSFPEITCASPGQNLAWEPVQKGNLGTPVPGGVVEEVGGMPRWTDGRFGMAAVGQSWGLSSHLHTFQPSAPLPRPRSLLSHFRIRDFCLCCSQSLSRIHGNPTRHQ